MLEVVACWHPLSQVLAELQTAQRQHSLSGRIAALRGHRGLCVEVYHAPRSLLETQLDCAGLGLLDLLAVPQRNAEKSNAGLIAV